MEIVRKLPSKSLLDRAGQERVDRVGQGRVAATMANSEASQVF